MGGKPWKLHSGYGGRRTNYRDVKQRFLIVCEGDKTEPLYFEGFRVPKDVFVEIVPGQGKQLSVVRRAIKHRDESADEYDQVWCVFDRDKDTDNPNDARNFNSAMQLAKRNDIKVAYTNDAFELWYLLHFNYYDMALHRHDYLSRLNGLIDGGYEKNDPQTYSKLEDKMKVAMRNANRLLSQYDPVNPEKDDPSTTVQNLVSELKKYI
jgi:hypothetical protein